MTAGVIGILAFLLAVPMSIAANVLTPRVSLWWARTSVLRKNRRIARLKARLGMIEVFLPFDALHDFLRSTVGAGISALIMMLSLQVFVAVNNEYIAILNGQIVDEPVDLNLLKREGHTLLGFVIVSEAALFLSLGFAGRSLTYVSPKRRELVKHRIQLQIDSLSNVQTDNGARPKIETEAPK